MLLIASVAFFLFRKKWRLSLGLLIIALVVNWWGECVPIRLFDAGIGNKREGLRVICYNIDGATGDPQDKASSIATFLHDHSADVVFIAEFNEQYPQSLDSSLSKEYGFSTYPDSLFFQYFYGEQPFFNSRRLKNSKGEWIGVYACSTLFMKDTIDLYGCHLASNNYGENHERIAPDEIRDKDKLLLFIRNINKAAGRREEEVEALVKELKKSKHESIVLGDMNEVGGAPAIRILERAGLKDAWWEGGVGYGATILSTLPYRIDHIMHTKGLKLKSIRVLKSNGISDHNVLYAEFTR